MVISNKSSKFLMRAENLWINLMYQFQFIARLFIFIYILIHIPNKYGIEIIQGYTILQP